MSVKCHSRLSIHLANKLAWVLLNYSEKSRSPSAIVSLPSWHDQCCRYHRAHRSLSESHPFLWCTRSSVERNRLNARYPIVERRECKWSNVIDHLHRWSPQECSHASHSTFVRWYFDHLRQRWSQPELECKRTETIQSVTMLPIR